MLENLNPEQKLATQTTEGAVLVLSGAGTGKTSVLVARIAYILDSGLAAPWQILALTFTNKAANEMKKRVADGNENPTFKIMSSTDGIWCGTFHSICLRILRANADRVGLRKDFLIYGEDEQKSVLKSVFANLGLDESNYSAGDWVEKISSIKDKGRDYKTDGMAKKIYDAYNAELARLNAADFGDLILKVLDLFANAPDVLEHYQRRFKYVMVDEFQDTNNAQYQFVSAIAAAHGNICCVGDDDQSIYSWRGAEIRHILNFEKNYPGAKIIRLETNYRSTSNILNAANSLIAHNAGRLGKDLRAAPGVGDGEKVYIITLPTDLNEARMISDAISRAGDNYSNKAVLIRAGSLSRPIEEEFAERRIPYRLVGATKFYDRMEIRDVIAYIRLMAYPFDDMSFLRVIAKPRRGIGGVTLAKLRGFGQNYMTALCAAPLSGKMRAAADEFLRAFDFDWDAMRPADAVSRLLDNSGYIQMWNGSRDADAPDRIMNIKELITNVISKYDTIAEFLEHAALMITDDDDREENGAVKNVVNIMTIHAAKGLEFDTVFLPAWEEGIFPNERAIGEGALEEERRLAYVAITRARRRAVISNVMSRMLFGQRQYNTPSRFIAEMNREYLDIQGGGAYYQPKTAIPTSYAKKKPLPNTSIVGKLASHDELGRGVVIEDAGDILTIAFRDKGIKKVAREFVKISG